MDTEGRNIRVKQGLRADLPVLRIGELGFATDDFSFWIGSEQGNKQVNSTGEVVIEDGSISQDKLTQELQDKINNINAEIANGSVTLEKLSEDLQEIINNSTIEDGSITIEKLSQSLQDTIESFVVIDNLNSTSSTNPVSANQARLLNQDISEHKSKNASLTEKGHVFHGVTTATISTNWNGSQAPFTQVVVVEGIMENDSPFVTVDYSEDVYVAIAERDAYQLIDSAVTGLNTIEFRCFEEAPTIPLNIQVKVVR